MYESPNIVIPKIQNLHDIDVYVANGGYSAYKKSVGMTSDEVIDTVKKSGLRGRGGACFPTGMKWSFMPKGNDKPKYLCINGDESEPGSFKDRQILEYNPHQLIEGIMIAGYAMGITTAFIYIRGEYHAWVDMMQKAVDQAYAKGYLGTQMKQTFGGNYSMDIVVHKGAGAYVCGEETALMSSLEGDRGYPRFKPPFPANKGLYGMPTTINNVETLATVPPIMIKGPEWYSQIGAAGHCGTLLYGLSGHLNTPGVYELPTDVSLNDLIYKWGGGVPGGKKVKAVIPGGSSMPPLRGDEIDGVIMNNEDLKKYGTFIGTGGVMVMDEDTDIPKILLRIVHFYHHESCGQCTPCREGCGWMEKLLKRIVKGDATSQDLHTLKSVADNINGNTICALGDAAAWPVQGFLKKFWDEFEAKVSPNRSFIPLNVVHGRRATAETLLRS